MDPTDTQTKHETFLIVILHAVAGGSLVLGLHELDKLLMLGTPVVVLAFLTLVIGALGAAVLAAAMRSKARLVAMRRMLNASVALLIAAYLTLAVSAWVGYFTNPDMLEEPAEDTTVL